MEMFDVKIGKIINKLINFLKEKKAVKHCLSMPLLGGKQGSMDQ